MYIFVDMCVFGYVTMHVYGCEGIYIPYAYCYLSAFVPDNAYCICQNCKYYFSPDRVLYVHNDPDC